MTRIRTVHLLLRPFTPADEAAFARVVLGNPVTMRQLPAGRPAPPQRAAAILADYAEHWRRHGHGTWAVMLAADDVLIGLCGLQRVDSGPRVELSVALCPPHQRSVLPLEAAQAALRYGFELAGLAQVMAVALPRNRDSRRLWRQLGLRPAGRVHLHEQWLPLYTLLRGDFVQPETVCEFREEG